MGRTSGRRAARSFCEAILWQNDAFWDAEQLEDEDYGCLPFIKKFRKFWLGIFGR